MKTLALLSLSLAVALGAPPFAPDVAREPILPEEDRIPLTGDWVPVQGHVVVEDPLPQVRIGYKEQEGKQALVPVDAKQSQTMVEQEVKVRPQVQVEQEEGVKTEDEKEPEVKGEQEVNVKPEIETDFKVESDVKVELDVQKETVPEVKSMVDEKHKVQEEALLQDGEPIMELEPEVREEPFVHQQIMPEFHVQMDHEKETETGEELEERHIDMERKYEMVAEPIMELEPLDDDDMFREEVSNTELSEEKPFRAALHPLPEEGGLMRQRNYALAGEPIMELEPEVREEPFVHQQIMPEFHVQMDLEKETETGEELEERHIDMKRKYEMVAEPIMELEPLDDDDMFREEVSNTEQGLMGKRDYVLRGEPIMQLEPEVKEEPFIHQQARSDAAIVEERPALWHEIPPSEEYFPNEEARMRVEHHKQQQRLNDLMMEEPGSEFVWREDSSPDINSPVFGGVVQIGVVPGGEKGALMRQEVKTPAEGRLSPATWQSCRSCVALDGKQYQFFKGPKSAAEAELFCQEHFPGGHLASITSPNIHRELTNIMLQQNGAYTRCWIGGLRYFETGRFIWLDGSQWSYADWLSGEPNNTADMEDCVEVLALENGKFNDHTCRERQAFICSYPYQ